jgi:voltage-gated potassium channel
MSAIRKGHFWPPEARRRPWLLLALLLTIPAFYLVLTAFETGYYFFGRALYGLVALILAWDIVLQYRQAHHHWVAYRRRAHFLDLLIFAAALICVVRVDAAWSPAEWWWRLLYCAVVFVRLTQLLVGFFAPTRLLQILLIGGLMLVLAGAGFLWLEPKVHTFADGMWLAFTTVSTVGYGDIVPSSPAARIFAVFIVLLGYALFSVVTASIAALFIGEDEKRLERELHADIRALRQEVAALREDLQKDKHNPS